MDEDESGLADSYATRLFASIEVDHCRTGNKEGCSAGMQGLNHRASKFLDRNRYCRMPCLRGMGSLYATRVMDPTLDAWRRRSECSVLGDREMRRSFSDLVCCKRVKCLSRDGSCDSKYVSET